MRKWWLLVVVLLAAGLLVGCKSGTQPTAEQPQAEAGQMEGGKMESGKMEAGQQEGGEMGEAGKGEMGEAGEGGEMGGGMAGAMQGDPKRGEQLFKQTVLGQNAGCVTCHSLEPDVTLVGPSLAGIATRAAQRVSGMSAEEYLRQSILEPDAYLVEGFAAGTMPSFKGQLSDQDLADLIAFLMTLK